MIAQITLPGTSVSVSRLTFGTSRLFSAGSATTRYKVIEAALASGFSHFDTAPSYGFGMAERDLGEVLGAVGATTMTTKTGLYSPGGEDQSWPAIFARKALGRAWPSLSSAVADWSVERARRSLAASLDRLQRERVDFLLLHEAELPLANTDEWLRWIEEERGARVGHFGIAINADRLPGALSASRGFLDVIQTEDSLDGKEADPVRAAGRELQFTYGYLSSFGAHDVAQTLAAALQRNSKGSVLVSTIKPERVEQLAAAALC